MIKVEIINKLCLRAELGEIYKAPERIFGGLLHHMYKIETDKGIFAVKQLNPSIMKRKTAINNYIFSEKVAKIAYLNQIPAIAAIEKESCLYKIEDEYYMVFGWVEAKALPVEHVSVEHCKKIGKVLCDLHKLDFSEIEQEVDKDSKATVTEWNTYKVEGMVWSQELLEISDFLYDCERKANQASEVVKKHQIISHRDMDCKNVLWDKDDSPIVIDWEAAGYINPLQELIDVALAWAGGEILKLNDEKFKAVIDSYIKHGGTISSDIDAVLEFAYKGKLEWLEYNMKRSLGIESSSEQERLLGSDEVIKTIQSIYYYKQLIPRLNRLLRI